MKIRERDLRFLKRIKNELRLDFELSDVYKLGEPNYSEYKHLYVIADIYSNAVKIGVTVSLNQRFADLQCGNPNPLCLIYCFEYFGYLEKVIHFILKDYRRKGEWFTMDKTVFDTLQMLLDININENYIQDRLSKININDYVKAKDKVLSLVDSNFEPLHQNNLTWEDVEKELEGLSVRFSVN